MQILTRTIKIRSEKMEKKLEVFYQGLYAFEPEEMIEDPETFRAHIKTSLDTLFTESVSDAAAKKSAKKWWW